MQRLTPDREYYNPNSFSLEINNNFTLSKLQNDPAERERLLKSQGKEIVDITVAAPGWEPPLTRRGQAWFNPRKIQWFHVTEKGVFDGHHEPGTEVSKKPTDYCPLHAFVPPDVLEASKRINAQKEQRELMGDLFQKPSVSSATTQNEQNNPQNNERKQFGL